MTNLLRPITIVGGGLAGLTLGIGLRQHGVPVVLWEAGYYPRHRVCGEFISGRGQDVLRRLGLESKLLQAGACEAKTTAFFFNRRRAPVRELPRPALCLSRFRLDALLAAELRQAGGEIREGVSWAGAKDQPGMVFTTGRRRQNSESGARWFGLKIHARSATLSADLEMHTLPQGYVGISRLPEGEINICGLFQRRPNAAGAGRPLVNERDRERELLHGRSGTTLSASLANAEFDESSFCAIAGLDLQPRRASAAAQCRLGDALTMIPPVTGNGMSMAFEAAEAALPHLHAFSNGGLDWYKARNRIARACDRLFARRLAWAKYVQWLMFTPALHVPAALLFRSTPLWRLLFECTR